MVFFNPSSPRYQRGVMLLQYGLMGIAAFSVLLTNWGTREQVFSGVILYFYLSDRDYVSIYILQLQKHIIPKIDRLYNISEDEITVAKNKYLESVARDNALITLGLETQVTSQSKKE